MDENGFTHKCNRFHKVLSRSLFSSFYGDNIQYRTEQFYFLINCNRFLDECVFIQILLKEVNYESKY